MVVTGGDGLGEVCAGNAGQLASAAGPAQPCPQGEALDQTGCYHGHPLGH